VSGLGEAAAAAGADAAPPAAGAATAVALRTRSRSPVVPVLASQPAQRRRRTFEPSPQPAVPVPAPPPPPPYDELDAPRFALSPAAPAPPAAAPADAIGLLLLPRDAPPGVVPPAAPPGVAPPDAPPGVAPPDAPPGVAPPDAPRDALPPNAPPPNAPLARRGLVVRLREAASSAVGAVARSPFGFVVEVAYAAFGQLCAGCAFVMQVTEPHSSHHLPSLGPNSVGKKIFSSNRGLICITVAHGCEEVGTTAFDLVSQLFNS
jgi:hypothetical protein